MDSYGAADMLGSRLSRSACSVLLTATIDTPVVARTAEHWFAVSGRPEFTDLQAQLQVVVDEHAHHRTNRFCVMGEMVEASTVAWVYWPEEGKLILWRPDRDNPHAIAGSKRYLDLKRDLVEGNDVHGSTYRLTRATADEKIRACERHGEIYTIELLAGSGAHG